VTNPVFRSNHFAVRGVRGRPGAMSKRDERAGFPSTSPRRSGCCSRASSRERRQRRRARSQSNGSARARRPRSWRSCGSGFQALQGHIVGGIPGLNLALPRRRSSAPSRNSKLEAPMIQTTTAPGVARRVASSARARCSSTPCSAAEPALAVHGFNSTRTRWMGIESRFSTECGGVRSSQNANGVAVPAGTTGPSSISLPAES
jgi:hypothetical protein